MANEQPVIVALGPEYGYFYAHVHTDTSINSIAILPKINDILMVLKDPFNLLVVDPENLYPGSTNDNKYVELWQNNQGLFGFYALQQLIEDKVVPTNKLQVITTNTPRALETITRAVGLVVPQEAIAHIKIDDQETILQTIIQARLGTITK